VAGGTAGEAMCGRLNRRPWSLPAPIARSVWGAHAIVTTSPRMIALRRVGEELNTGAGTAWDIEQTTRL